MKTVASWIQVAAPEGMLGKSLNLLHERLEELQYSLLASGIPKNFFALHKYPGSRVASRHRVETENVSHERLSPNTCSKKSDVPEHHSDTSQVFRCSQNSCVNDHEQSALSLALTYSIPGILASFNAK